MQFGETGDKDGLLLRDKLLPLLTESLQRQYKYIPQLWPSTTGTVEL